MPFAILLTVILAALAVFQLALASGAPIGRFAWGGQHRVLPLRLRVGSAVSILIYAFIVLVAFTRLGVGNWYPEAAIFRLLPEDFAIAAMWVVFAYFCVGIVMNAVSRSRPERYTMVPVCAVLAVLSLCVARGMGSAAMPA
ncbi:hypothetical protein [Microbacterium sp. P04]|uniref:hypothetical protein n=1 Tax=Microbacterium sp. P04 TaxID=3366947 RepID=UPI0037457963